MRRSSTLFSLLCLMLSCTVLEAQDLSPSRMAPEVKASYEKAAQAAKDAHWFRALKFYNEALTTARSQGDSFDEAYLLHSIGLVYMNISQPQKALTYCEQTLDISTKKGYKRITAASLYSIGSVYRSLGQPQKALEYFQKALSVHREMGNNRGESITLNSIGLVYLALGQMEEARQNFEKAYPLAHASGDKTAEVNSLNTLATTYLHSGETKRALEIYQQALNIAQTLGSRLILANTLSNLGRVYEVMKQPQKALDDYGQALALQKESGDRRGEAETWARMAYAQEQAGNLTEADQDYTKAVFMLERLRARLGDLTDAKQSFLASRLGIYDGYMDLLLLQNKTPLAFNIAQKTKSRDLLDLMQNGRVDLTAQMTEEEKTQEESLREETDRLNRAMIAEGVINEAGSKQRFEALKVELEKAESDLKKFEDRLYARYPQLSHLRAAQTLRYTDLSSFLPEDTALLDYAMLRGNLGDGVLLNDIVLFVVTRNRGRVHADAIRLHVKRARMEKLTRDLLESCSKSDASYQAGVRSMSDLLLPSDARKAILNKRRLLICPDGPLWNVPFQALLTEEGRFLLEKYEVTYACSASGAYAAQQAKSESRRPQPSGSLLVMANPDFGGENRFGADLPIFLQRPLFDPTRPLLDPTRPLLDPTRPLLDPTRTLPAPSRPLMDPTRSGIAPLPGTQQEADALKQDFPDGRILVGKQAQEATFKAEAGKYRYLHLATHGYLNNAAPLLSNIVLAQPDPESKEDGFLTAREIFDMKLSAEMVVLSACNTARGGYLSGEGVVGLTWALFVAGVPTQIVSQWGVSDASTALLMQRFYANLKQGQSKGQALRNAELTLLSDPRYRHPHFWAPFILMGDWR
jgi:CHAT domain-containing protein